MQLIINDALHEEDHGSVTCIPDAHICQPVQITWRVGGGAEIHDPQSQLQADASGLHAGRVPVGRVDIRLVDGHGKISTANVMVGCRQLPTITGYTVVTHATSAHARDGEVTVSVEHAPASVAYLWTNGVLTSEPVLRLVTPGVYTAAMVAKDGAQLRFVHAAAPAQVSVRPTSGVT